MHRTSRLIRPALLLIVMLTTLVGCATYADLPHGTVKQVSSAVTERENITLPPELPDQAPPPDYLIGSGDVLLVTVAGKPEFSTAGQGTAGKFQGSRVDGNGAIRLPLVGSVAVAGLTVSQAATRLQETLQTYVRDPSVVVEVAEYRSQPLYLLGQFKSAGTYYLDRPLKLTQGVALGNGFDQLANLTSARVSRDNRIMRVDLADLLINGNARQNIWLKGGDSIYIPDNRSQQVFVFGAVKKPGPVPIPPAGLNLAQAIAAADFRDSGYDIRHVRIIRSLSPIRGELMVVNLEMILRGEALPLQLQEGDIIFVPKNGFGTWNDAIAEMLPSLQAVSYILQPFVSIKYLSQ